MAEGATLMSRSGYHEEEFQDYIPRRNKERNPRYYRPPTSPLDRTVKCGHCAATFRSETAHIFRAKHERDFHHEGIVSVR